MKHHEDDLLTVIIETPAQSRHKYAFDEQTGLFRLKKTLPVGMAFPFDFGFIPGTRGEDGDPLDILIIMEQPAFPGCLLDCRLLGMLKATQQEHNETPVRNDRLIAVASTSQVYGDLRTIGDLPRAMTKQIEHFFENYNREEGKVFDSKGWEGADKAWKLIRKSLEGGE